MAKARAPLISLNASGKLGNLVIRAGAPGAAIVQTAAPERGAPSSKQAATRTHYKQGTDQWHAYDQAARDYYAAETPQLSTNKGFSNFTRAWMKGEEMLNLGKGIAILPELNPPHTEGGEWYYVPLYDDNILTAICTSDPAPENYMEWQILLPPGKYRVVIATYYSRANGMLHVNFGGHSNTIDCYKDTEGEMTNQEILDEVTIPTTGTYPLRISGTEKNPASEGYYLVLSQITIVREE